MFKVMFIETNPKGKVYTELLDLAFEFSDEFILVVRPDINRSDSLKWRLYELKPYLKEVKEQFEWPGTIYCGDKPALVYYYYPNKYTKKILKEVSNSLYDWVQPKLPEDLSFIKNHEPWLINTAHEYQSEIIIYDESILDALYKIEGLEIRLVDNN